MTMPCSPSTACKGLALGFVPFRSTRSRGSRLTTVPKAAQTGREQILPTSLATLLLSTPARAQEAATQLQDAASQIQSDLPSSLPSPEEVSAQIADKVPASGGSILELFADNPVLIAGLAFLAAVPIALNFLQGGALGVKQVNAAGALEGLSSDPSTILLDIRSREEVKEQGTPDLSSVKKRPIPLPFTRLVKGDVEQIQDFADKFGQLRQVQSETSLILLDSYGKEGPEAAKLLAKLVGKVYYVQDGAVGPNGWKESGQPWKEPGKSFFNLDSLAEDFKSQPTFAKAGVAAGAVGIAAAVLFQEAGTVLELAAVAAAGAFALPRFLSPASAPSSGTTKRQVKEFVEGAEKDVKQAARNIEGGVEKASRQASSKAEETNVGRQAQQAAGSVEGAVKGVVEDPEQTAQEAQSALKDAGNEVEDATSEAQEALGNKADEAREWIENWRKDNAST